MYWISILFVMMVTACIKPDESATKVFQGAITQDFPAVVMIKQIDRQNIVHSCTATFIGPKTLITAAHCVEKNDYILWGEHRSLKIEYPAAYRFSHAYSREDVALVAFDRPLAPATLGFSLAAYSQALGGGEAFTFVGYGRPRLGTKTFGQNAIEAETCGMLLSKPNPPNEDNSDAMQPQVLSGDSGGPLLLNGGLVGITSAGLMKLSKSSSLDDRVQEDRSYRSTFTNLQMREVVDFICRRNPDSSFAGIDFPERSAYCHAFERVLPKQYDETFCRKI